MNYSAVIFDLFGTLVDDFVSSVGQMHSELAAVLKLPVEQFMQLWRQTSEMRTIGAFQTVEASIEYVCGQLGVQLTVEQLNNAVEIRLQLIRQTLKPKPDAVATLSQLRNKGHKLARQARRLTQDTKFALYSHQHIAD